MSEQKKHFKAMVISCNPRSSHSELLKIKDNMEKTKVFFDYQYQGLPSLRNSAEKASKSIGKMSDAFKKINIDYNGLERRIFDSLCLNEYKIISKETIYKFMNEFKKNSYKEQQTSPYKRQQANKWSNKWNKKIKKKL